ncbi:MAG TPA: helix-turn-helix domain-containing protein, partial [Candidatus Sulfotelmatobacter sp.]|nr:helix-turn-helix domain-containing protein [Candidatus Sulfotelmatobacter sp.]
MERGRMASERQRKSTRLRGSDKRRLGRHETGEEPVAEAVPYQGIGEGLRATRQRMGLDLQSVAAQLRIRYPHMVALEAGRFEELPGRIYAIGFLRTYAEHLRLDPDAVIEAFKEETSAIQAPGRLVFPIPAPETRTPRGWLILLCLIIAGGLYGAWYYSHNKTRVASDQVPPAPVVAASPAPPPAAAPAAGSSTAVPAPAAASTASAAAPDKGPPPAVAVNPAPPPAAVAPVPPAPPPAAIAPPAAAPPAVPKPTPAAVPAAGEPARTAAADTAAPTPAAPESTAQTFGSTEANVRVVLRAHGDSWIDVRGAN